MKNTGTLLVTMPTDCEICYDASVRRATPDVYDAFKPELLKRDRQNDSNRHHHLSFVQDPRRGRWIRHGGRGRRELRPPG